MIQTSLINTKQNVWNWHIARLIKLVNPLCILVFLSFPGKEGPGGFWSRDVIKYDKAAAKTNFCTTQGEWQYNTTVQIFVDNTVQNAVKENSEC